MAIFPLAADQIIAQMWSNGARGATPEYGMETSANATAAVESVVLKKQFIDIASKMRGTRAVNFH